jgi:DnaJ family protein A protein 2
MDLYAELGVERGATADDIKRAYRREAIKRHPDRGGEKESFQRLQIANEILSDPSRRAEYDATGRIPGAAEEGGGGGGPDLSSIFGSMFGGGFPMPPPGFFSGGGTNTGGRAQRGPNKIHEIGVMLPDLYTGKKFKLHMKREVLCGDCGGKGGKRVEPCRACRGGGVRMRAQQMGPMTAMIQEPCGECAQTGQRVLEACDGCAGRRVVERTSDLDVVIEPGMQDGDRIVFPGQCSESPLFDAPGDVVLVVRSAVPEGSAWQRRGAELVTEIQLTVAETLLGWSRNLEGHPSGRALKLAWRDGVLRDGEVLRVPGWGMPMRGGGMGEARLVCRVATMDQGAWTEEQMAALRRVWPDWNEPILEEGVERPMR